MRDPEVLARAIPGVDGVESLGDGRFAARIGFGVGPFVAVYAVSLVLAEIAGASAVGVSGDATGRFGEGRARGELRMTPLPRGGARLGWTFEGAVSGPVALAGARLLHAASERFCRRVAEGLDRELLRLDGRGEQAASRPTRTQR